MPCVHLTEARDLAELSDNAWLAAMLPGVPGHPGCLRGRLEEARALMDEALGLSLAAHSTRSVTLCLAAFARLALAEGDPERAARLAGRGRGPAPPGRATGVADMRRVEAELVAQVRQALGAGRFDQVFTAGARLTQREAVAIVRDQRGGRTPTS